MTSADVSSYRIRFFVRSLNYRTRIRQGQPNHLTLSQLGQVATLDEVVGLEENLTQARLADGVVLQVEFVKPMESVRVGLRNGHRQHARRPLH